MGKNFHQKINKKQKVKKWKKKIFIIQYLKLQKSKLFINKNHINLIRFFVRKEQKLAIAIKKIEKKYTNIIT